MILEYDFATTLDFGGINTGEGQSALTRVAKGGSCTASQLRALITLLTGADKLRKQVRRHTHTQRVRAHTRTRTHAHRESPSHTTFLPPTLSHVLHTSTYPPASLSRGTVHCLLFSWLATRLYNVVKITFLVIRQHVPP